MFAVRGYLPHRMSRNAPAPRVSVIIPCWNDAAELENCLTAVAPLNGLPATL